jgi:hypothetical protein
MIHHPEQLTKPSALFFQPNDDDDHHHHTVRRRKRGQQQQENSKSRVAILFYTNKQQKNTRFTQSKQKGKKKATQGHNQRKGRPSTRAKPIKETHILF